MKILDCTLRDGGYYNNWDFSDNLVKSFLTNIAQLPIDYIEVGYRSTPQKPYFGKYFYLPDFVIQDISKIAGNKKLAIMLNEKSMKPEDAKEILPSLKPYVRLIRIAVDPEKFDRAVILAKAIKELGFEISFNLMYMSKYHKNKDFLSKLKGVKDLLSFVYLVDSYGGMIPSDVSELVKQVKYNCSVEIGFHGHNNLELAFANTLAAIDAGCDIVDGTILGMGRGAGNLKTELLLTYLASNKKLHFDFNVLAKIIETWMPLYEEHQWGTNLPYMVSGAISMPQKDVMEWVTQRFYSYNSIIRALKNQEAGEADNIRLPVFKPNESFENVLIIGGGPSAEEHSTVIKRFVEKCTSICIIHASAKNAGIYKDVKVPQYFCLVGNEGHRLEEVFEDLDNFKGHSILPPFPRKMGTYIPRGIIDKSFELKEISFTSKYKDAHTSLALQTALNLNANTTYVVGYDGYSHKLITPREQALFKENDHIFTSFEMKSKIFSLLPSQYSIPQISIYTLIN